MLIDSEHWIDLSIKLNFEKNLIREILFEKYSQTKSKEIAMNIALFSILHNCFLFRHQEYPDYIFFIKKIDSVDKVLMEKNMRTKSMQIKYKNFWEIFEVVYGLEEDEIEIFIKNAFKKINKLQGCTIESIIPSEEVFNMQNYKIFS